MSSVPHTARVLWERAADEPFIDNRYSRRHTLSFDGGATWTGSSSPHVVRLPLSDPAGVDPEEMLVAALSACHMLWFLSLAAEDGFRIDRYLDDALGAMERDRDGRMSMTRVVLRPQVRYSGERRPTPQEQAALHHRAHDCCFIANSVKTDVRVEPVDDA